MLMLKCQNMKIEVRSKTLVNIILLLLYMESCCGFTIDREGRDISASFDQSNCNSIPRTFASQPGRCKCDRTPKSSIASTIAGTIACVENEDIDTSKYTCMLHYSVISISLRKILTSLPFYFSSH